MMFSEENTYLFLNSAVTVVTLSFWKTDSCKCSISLRKCAIKINQDETRFYEND